MTELRQEAKRANGAGNRPRPRTPRHFEAVALDGISAEALKLHIGLYQGYVKALNELLEAHAQLARPERPMPLLRDALARRFAFEWNGIRLHELFFDGFGDALKPEGAGTAPVHQPPPDGPLVAAMTRDFGSFDEWRDDARAMGSLRGIGWVLAVWDPLDGRLANVWVESHEIGLPAGAVILAAFDLWEHAYLTDYAPAARGEYFDALLANLDFAVVEARLRGRRPPEHVTGQRPPPVDLNALPP